MLLDRLRHHPPLGASIADWLAKPAHDSGLGLGDAPVVAILGVLILALVIYLAITKSDVQQPLRPGTSDHEDLAERQSRTPAHMPHDRADRSI
ncbi:hypothetical protein [Nocardia sp. NPDC004123]